MKKSVGKKLDKKTNETITKRDLFLGLAFHALMTTRQREVRPLSWDRIAEEVDIASRIAEKLIVASKSKLHG
jgi:hypothetical protein